MFCIFDSNFTYCIETLIQKGTNPMPLNKKKKLRKKTE